MRIQDLFRTNPATAAPSTALTVANSTVPTNINRVAPLRTTFQARVVNASPYPAGSIGLLLDQRFINESYPEMHYGFLNAKAFIFDCRGSRQFVSLKSIASFKVREGALLLKLSTDEVYKIAGLKNMVEVTNFLANNL